MVPSHVWIARPDRPTDKRRPREGLRRPPARLGIAVWGYFCSVMRPSTFGDTVPFAVM
jgi:hypothetical protein